MRLAACTWLDGRHGFLRRCPRTTDARPRLPQVNLMPHSLVRRLTPAELRSLFPGGDTRAWQNQRLAAFVRSQQHVGSMVVVRVVMRARAGLRMRVRRGRAVRLGSVGDRRGRGEDQAAGLDPLGADQAVGQLADRFASGRGAGSPRGSGGRRGGRGWSSRPGSRWRCWSSVSRSEIRPAWWS